MYRLLALVVIIGLVASGAFLAKANPASLEGYLLKSNLRRLVKEEIARSGGQAVTVAVECDADWEAVTRPLRTALAEHVAAGRVAVVPSDAAPTIRARAEASGCCATLHYRVRSGSERVVRITWLVVVPPLLAITAAMLFQWVVPCLTLGLFAGGVIAMWQMGVSPLHGFGHAIHAYLWREVILNPSRLEIMAFVVLIGATMGIARAAGGTRGVLEVLTRYCRSARATRLATLVAGLLIFFDDYVNCIIVGNAMRPLTDRYRVSREKLAYIVDSTAAPVAGLSIVSTWIAHELIQIETGLDQAGVDIPPYAMFVQAVPFRFYCWFALATVLLVCWLGRDLSPMRAAAERAAKGPCREPTLPAGEGAGVPAKARYAVVPIGLTLVSILVALWWTARPGMASEPAPAGVLDAIRLVLWYADAMQAFFVASLAGFATAVLMARGSGVLSGWQIARASLRSTNSVWIVLVVLILAWGLGSACKEIGTAPFLVALFQAFLTPVVFGATVFLVSCLISFAMGTPYGTMAIVLPNIVPLAFAVGDGSGCGGMALATISIGAVLDGSVFGCHCSPLADTTILSSLSSGCGLVEHVRTQFPYALLAMVVALLVGYIPAALGCPAYLSLGAGFVVLVLTMRFLAKPIKPTPTPT